MEYKFNLRVKKLFSTISNTNVSCESGKGWLIDLKKRVVNYPVGDLKTLSDKEIIGCLLHELAHALYTKPPRGQYAPKFEYEQLLLNALEDIRIEYRIQNNYPNAGELLTLKFESTYKGFSKKYIKSLDNPTLFLFNLIIFSKGYPLIGNNQELKANINNLEYHINTCQYIDSTTGIVRCWNQILESFKKYLPDNPKSPNTTQSFNKCQSKTKSKPQKAPGKPIEYKKGSKYPPKKFNFKPSNKSFTFNHTNQEIKFKPFSTYQEALANSSSLVNTFNNKITHILQDNQYNKFQSGFSSGNNIQTSKLYKFKTNNYRFFQKRYSKVKNYQFMILADVSGSMKKDIGNLQRSIVMLIEGFNKAKVGYGVSVFNDSYLSLKGIREPLTGLNKDKVAGISSTGGTDDLSAINKAYLEFDYSSKRILIVISDGCGYQDQVRQVIDSHPGITTIGIGLDTDVSKSYPINIQTSIEDLPMALITKLHEVI